MTRVTGCVRVFEESSSISSLDPHQIVSNTTLAHSHLQLPTRSRGEDSPWESAEDFTNQQYCFAWSEEDDEKKAAKSKESADEGLAWTEGGNKPTVENGSEEGTNTRRLAKPGLPAGSELVPAGGLLCNADKVAILSLERGWRIVSRP